jgi:uncharacterized protein YutE (UPF0331/DUF86 family)
VNRDDVVLERLGVLRNELVFLKGERTAARTLDAYAANTRLRKAVERSLHVAMEASLDIGRRIVAADRLRFPTTNQEVFEILAEEGIVPQE